MRTLRSESESKFGIGFTSEGCLNLSEGSACVLLELGDESERVESSLDFWSKDDYISHWQHMLNKIKTGNTAALVTSMVDPRIGTFVEWWPMWKVGTSRIAIRNQILMLNRFESVFNPAEPERYIGNRTLQCGEEQPSEWEISVEAIDSFIKRGFTSSSLEDV